MKQDFDLHLLKKGEKNSISRIIRKSTKSYIAVLLSVVLAMGSCIPSMAVEQPQTEETGSAVEAETPAVEAAAETVESVDGAVSVVPEENGEGNEGTSEEAAANEGASEPAGSAAEEEPASAETVNSEGQETGIGTEGAGNGNSGDDLEGAVPSVPEEDPETEEASQNEVRGASTESGNPSGQTDVPGTSIESGDPIDPNTSSWLRYFDYSVKGDTVVLEGGYKGSDTEVRVPGSATVDGIPYDRVMITKSISWRACKHLSFEPGVVFPNDCSGLFASEYYIQSIDLTNINTSNVLDMSDMFSSCYELRELDLSGFDTSRVLDMSDMFLGCISLTKLDVSGFNTSNVTDMSQMFFNCKKLTSLDVTSFDTCNVTDIKDIFYGDASLLELDLSSWDLSSLPYSTSITNQFPQTIKTPFAVPVSVYLVAGYKDAEGNIYECLPMNLNESITLTIVNDLPGWLRDYSFKIDTYSFQNKCILTAYNGSASELTVPGNVSINGKDYRVYVEEPSIWSKGVTSLSFEEGFVLKQASPGAVELSSTDLKHLDLQYVDMSQCYDFIITGLTALETINTPVGFSESILLPTAFVDADGKIYSEIPANMTESITLTKLKVSEWLNDYQYDIEEDRIILSRYKGSGGTVTVYGSATIGSKEINIIEVTEETFHFNESYPITQIIFKQGVKIPGTYNNPFSWINKLTSIDLSGADFSNVQNADNMISGCVFLTTIQAPVNLTANIYLPGLFTDELGNTYLSLPTNLSESITLTKSEQHSAWLNDFAYHIEDNKIVLTGGYYGTESDYTVPGSADVGEQHYDKVELSSSLHWYNSGTLSFSKGVVLPEDSSWMFSSISAMSVDLTNVDATCVSNMENMFSFCRNLRFVNMGGIDTSNVTNMRSMFAYCYVLESVDFSGINTSGVTNMEGMYTYSTQLTSLDMSGFDTSNVTNMSDMFFRSKIGELDIRGWNLYSLNPVGRTPFGGDIETIYAPAGIPDEVAKYCTLNRQYTGSNGKNYWYLPEHLDESITLSMIEGSESGEPITPTKMFRVTFDTENCDITVIATNSNGTGRREIHDGDYVGWGTRLYITPKAWPGCYLYTYPVEMSVDEDTTITVKAIRKGYKLTMKSTVGAVSDPTSNVADMDNILFGTSVTLTAGEAEDGYEFIGWYQRNGKLLTSDKQYTFMMYGNKTCEARYQLSTGIVTFVSNDIIVDSITVPAVRNTKSGAAGGIDAGDFPEAPTPLYGFEFDRWDKTAEEINAELANGKNVIVTALFKEIQKPMRLTIYNQEQSTPEYQDYANSQWVSVTAKPVEGKSFAHWTLDGELLSNNSTAVFRINSDCVIKAVYTQDVVEPVGTATIMSSTYDESASKLITVALLTVPEGAVITKAGLFAASSSKFNPSTQELDEGTAEFIKASTKAVGTGGPVSYTWTKSKVNRGDTWYLRAYVIYEYNGEMKTILGKTITVIAGNE